MTPFLNLQSEICAYFKNQKFAYYGEAVFKKSDEEAVRYVTIDKSPKACAVNDGLDWTAFFTRENASEAQDDGNGYGRGGTYLRKVDCILAVNSKRIETEAQMAFIVNQTTEIEYLGTDYDSERVARDFFGMGDRNYETYFFTIRFRATETLSCPPC